MLKSLFKTLVNKRKEPYASDEDESRRNKVVTQMILRSESLRDHGYVDYPVFVHLETLTVCNAACYFCPYPTVTRKGNRMPDGLIEKIIDDLTAIPPDIKFLLAPYKLSDPFLEPRLFDILGLVRDKLPNAQISLITNGSALTEKKIEQLASYPNISYLNVSLNDIDPVRYEQIMALPLDRTLRRLKALHERAQARPLDFPIRLTRVSGAPDENADFKNFVADRFPLFKPIVVNRNDWIGEVVTAGSSKEIPDAPCQRWFDISITSTGEVARCCMDSEARYSKGNVRDRSVLEIYNQPALRDLRERLISRKAAPDPCYRCTYR